MSVPGTSIPDLMGNPYWPFTSVGIRGSASHPSTNPLSSLPLSVLPCYYSMTILRYEACGSLSLSVFIFLFSRHPLLSNSDRGVRSQTARSCWDNHNENVLPMQKAAPSYYTFRVCTVAIKAVTGDLDFYIFCSFPREDATTSGTRIIDNLRTFRVTLVTERCCTSWTL